MEVDMQLPAFRTPRNASTPKRPRSPPSPSPLERPSKRLSFGVNNSVSIPLSQFAGMGVPPPPPMRSRQMSEDWVIQTRGLRIVGDGNSPQPEERAFTPIPEDAETHGCGAESPQMDGDMVRACYQGHDDSNGYDHSHISYLPCSRNEQVMDNDEPMTSPAPTAPPNSPAQIALSTPSSSSSLAHLDPSHSLRQTQYFLPTFVPSASCDSHPTTPLPIEETEEPQDINMHSPRIPPTPANIRRQRFTMGPRADCEKCRMGVKGHWIHVD